LGGKRKDTAAGKNDPKKSWGPSGQGEKDGKKDSLKRGKRVVATKTGSS